MHQSARRHDLSSPDVTTIGDAAAVVLAKLRRRLDAQTGQTESRSREKPDAGCGVPR